MTLTNSFGRLPATRWFPAASAVLICFGAVAGLSAFYKYRLDLLLTRAHSTLQNANSPRPQDESEEDQTPAAIAAGSMLENSTESGEATTANLRDQLRAAELTHQDLWTELAEHEFLESRPFSPSSPEDGPSPTQGVREMQTFSAPPVKSTPVPSNADPRSPPPIFNFNSLSASANEPSNSPPQRASHISFAPLAPRYRPTSSAPLANTPSLRPRRRNHLADIITTALSGGSTVTINPPSNSASPAISSPATFPRTPFPSESPRPTGLFPWMRSPIPERVTRTPVRSPIRFSFGAGDARNAEAEQMETIDEESGVGLGLVGIVGGDGERRRRRRRSRHSRRGSRTE
jgi:hypothetical protein